MAGGLSALQGTVVIMGLPFAFVLFRMMLGVFKALTVEGMKEDNYRGSLAGSLSGRITPSEGSAHNWRQRLARAASFPSHEKVQRFMKEVGKPAMEEIREVMLGKDFKLEAVEGASADEHLALNVSLGGERDFTYQIWPLKCAMPALSIRATRADMYYYRLEAHLGEGVQGYDLAGYSKEQLIADILDQYERHMFFLHTQRKKPADDTRIPDDPATADR
jgi:choline/glycine/proline betaine transport protein